MPSITVFIMPTNSFLIPSSGFDIAVSIPVNTPTTVFFTSVNIFCTPLFESLPTMPLKKSRISSLNFAAFCMILKSVKNPVIVRLILSNLSLTPDFSSSILFENPSTKPLALLFTPSNQSNIQPPSVSHAVTHLSFRSVTLFLTNCTAVSIEFCQSVNFVRIFSIPSPIFPVNFSQPETISSMPLLKFS